MSCYNDSVSKFNCTRSRDTDFMTHEEATFRYDQKYHGKTPKARVEANLNYYDHNILNLSNRVVTPVNIRKGEIVFDTIGRLRGSKSCENVLLVEY